MSQQEIELNAEDALNLGKACKETPTTPISAIMRYGDDVADDKDGKFTRFGLLNACTLPVAAARSSEQHIRTTQDENLHLKKSNDITALVEINLNWMGLKALDESSLAQGYFAPKCPTCAKVSDTEWRTDHLRVELPCPNEWIKKATGWCRSQRDSQE
jgi:hypothetical protein